MGANEGVKPVLPMPIRDTPYQHQIKAFNFSCGLPPPYALAVLSGTGSKKLDTLRHMNGAALQAVVVNYESAWRLEKDLSAWRPDLIVADEGHKAAPRGRTNQEYV